MSTIHLFPTDGDSFHRAPCGTEGFGDESSPDPAEVTCLPCLRIAVAALRTERGSRPIGATRPNLTALFETYEHTQNAAEALWQQVRAARDHWQGAIDQHTTENRITRENRAAFLAALAAIDAEGTQ